MRQPFTHGNCFTKRKCSQGNKHGSAKRNQNSLPSRSSLRLSEYPIRYRKTSPQNLQNLSPTLGSCKQGETQIATLKEEFELLKAKINAGKGNEVCHVVFHSAELKRKRENPQQSTRIVFNARTAEAWTEFQMQKERYMSIAVDPHIGVDLIIKALAAFSDATIRGWANQAEEPSADQALDETPLPEFLQD